MASRRDRVGAVNQPARKHSHRWRDYETPSGRRPVKEFYKSLSEAERAEVFAALTEIRLGGMEFARHLRGEIWEARAKTDTTALRVLFAPEGKQGQVLLSLEAFKKKTRKTPPKSIELAEKRLKDWRARGKAKKG